jgi:hypothetical protein
MNPILRAALALLLFLVIAPAIARADAVPATVAYIEGDATIIDPAGHSQKVISQMQIAPGSTLKTGADGTVGLKLTPGATTVVGHNTTMKITGLDYSRTADGQNKREIMLDLKQGALYNSLVKKDGQSDFQITTPEGVAAARGTDWSVTVSGKGVKVAVVDGTVVITLPNGHKIMVPAGKVAVSTIGGPGNLTYVISGLTTADVQLIIREIEKAGFHLAGGNGVTSVYSNESPQTLNPANISVTPTQSPNQ